MPFLRLLGRRHRAHTLAVIAAFALGGWPALAVHAAPDAGQAVIGKWKFTAALDSSEITALDESEAQHLVGHVFTISRKEVKFGTRVCLPPSLEAERVETRLYLREQAHASPENLHLPNPVTVVQLGCTIAFVKEPDRLVIHWKGWFFDAVKLSQAGSGRRK
jgi:hypothetical protein